MWSIKWEFSKDEICNCSGFVGNREWDFQSSCPLMEIEIYKSGTLLEK